MFKNLKLRYKILLPVTVVCVVIFATIMTVVQMQIQAKSEQEIRQLATEISARYANLIKTDLDAAIGAAKAMAAAVANERAQETPNREIVASQLRRTLEAFPNIFGVWTAWDPGAFDGRDAEFVKANALHEESGRFLPYIIRGANGIEETYTTPVLSTDRAEDTKWFWYPLLHKKMLLVEPTEYEVAGQMRMMVSVCVPLLEKGLGVAGLDLSLENLQGIAERISIFDTGYGILLSNTGMIVAHPEKELIGKNMAEFLDSANKAAVTTALASGATTFFSQISTATGQDMLYCMTPIALEGVEGTWSFVITVPMDKLFENARNIQNLLLGMSLGGLILLVAAIFLITRFITQPVRQIMEAAQGVASGNLDQPINIHQRDEIGSLAESLRGMVDALKAKIRTADAKTHEAEEQTRLAKEAMAQAEAERQRAARARAEGLSQAGARLEKIMQVIVSASERMTAQTKTMLRGTDEQEDRIQSTATSMEEMNATVLEIARNASQAADVGQAAQTKAQQGAEVVRKAKSSMEDAVKDVETLQANMAALGQQAQSIGAIIGVINDIADQTNLLALNAAIEAARAGDAGRGFAVVADEVRKLAEKTMSATKEVSDSISSIQRAAGNNIQGMKTTFGRIAEANQFSSQSGEVLYEIVEQSEVSAAQIRSIATAAEEQSSASEEINRAIDDINRLTQETSQGVREVAESITGLATQIAELNAIVHQLKHQED